MILFNFLFLLFYLFLLYLSFPLILYVCISFAMQRSIFLCVQRFVVVVVVVVKMFRARLKPLSLIYENSHFQVQLCGSASKQATLGRPDICPDENILLSRVWFGYQGLKQWVLPYINIVFWVIIMHFMCWLKSEFKLRLFGSWSNTSTTTPRRWPSNYKVKDCILETSCRSGRVHEHLLQWG